MVRRKYTETGMGNVLGHKLKLQNGQWFWGTEGGLFSKKEKAQVQPKWIHSSNFDKPHARFISNLGCNCKLEKIELRIHPMLKYWSGRSIDYRGKKKRLWEELVAKPCDLCDTEININVTSQLRAIDDYKCVLWQCNISCFWHVTYNTKIKRNHRMNHLYLIKQLTFSPHSFFVASKSSNKSKQKQECLPT